MKIPYFDRNIFMDNSTLFKKILHKNTIKSTFREILMGFPKHPMAFSKKIFLGNAMKVPEGGFLNFPEGSTQFDPLQHL